MAPIDRVVAEIVSRKPFAVLGYSAEDAVWCPRCLRSAVGLSPGRVDTSGRQVTPLYARDRTVREEVCDNCELPLLDLLVACRDPSPPSSLVAHLRTHGKRTALDFDRVPTIEIRTALKASGWRWDPRLRVWWSGEALPRVPAGVVIPSEVVSVARAKGPIVHRRTESVDRDRQGVRKHQRPLPAAGARNRSWFAHCVGEDSLDTFGSAATFELNQGREARKTRLGPAELR